MFPNRTPRFVAIPLDDRPVNFQALAQLAAVAGVRLELPNRDLLGHFRQPGQPEELLAWLDHTLPGSDGLIVSVDMIAYGGLVASRPPSPPLPICRSRLEQLSAVIGRHGVPAMATTVLLRQSTTVTDKASRELWEKLFHLLSLPETRRRDAIAALLADQQNPPLARELAAHLESRARNHEINRLAIEFTAAGTFDHLLVLKEDCSPEGPHRSEEAALMSLAGQHRLACEVSFEPGADEGGMLLLARSLHRASNINPAICIDFRPSMLADHVPLYEDRPADQTVRSAVRAAGFTPGEPASLCLSVVSLGPAGTDLFASNPSLPAETPAGWPTPEEMVISLLSGSPVAGIARWPVQLELVSSVTPGPAGAPPPTPAAARRTGRRMPPGSVPAQAGAWALAEIGVANGFDSRLANGLLAAGMSGAFAAIAGWNTAANSVGSALAHLACWAYPGGDVASRKAAQVRYLLTRWIDDYVYQSLLRPSLLASVTAAGIDPYHFPGDVRPGEWLEHSLPDRARQELARFAGSMLPAPGGPVRLTQWPSVRAKFPWNRLFEIEIELGDIDVRDIS